MEPTRDTRQLTWFLAWAVVFCDIGTSVYYVPGIFYGNVGDNTPFFVLLTTLGFIPLALKYIEISWRNPEGGGVVTIDHQSLRSHVGLPWRHVDYHQLFSDRGDLRGLRLSLHRQRGRLSSMATSWCWPAPGSLLWRS